MVEQVAFQSLLRQRIPSCPLQGGDLRGHQQLVSIASSSANPFLHSTLLGTSSVPISFNRFFVSESLPALSIRVDASWVFLFQSLLRQRIPSCAEWALIARPSDQYGFNRFFVSESLPARGGLAPCETAIESFNRFFVSESLPAKRRLTEEIELLRFQSLLRQRIPSCCPSRISPSSPHPSFNRFFVSESLPAQKHAISGLEASSFNRFFVSESLPAFRGTGSTAPSLCRFNRFFVSESLPARNE